MIFTITSIARSLADYLSPVLPGVTMYEDPNQQDTETPAMFLQQRYAYMEKQLDGYYLRRIGLDLTYLEDFNVPDLHQRYLAAAERLDLALDTFPYTSGEGKTGELIRTYDREWTVDDDALHYKFELRQRVAAQKERNPMKAMKENITAKEDLTNGETSGGTTLYPRGDYER